MLLFFLETSSGQNLISANIGMSSLVEYLDLSHNDITTIDNDCFKVCQNIQMNHSHKMKFIFDLIFFFSGLATFRNVDIEPKFH